MPKIYIQDIILPDDEILLQKLQEKGYEIKLLNPKWWDKLDNEYQETIKD